MFHFEDFAGKPAIHLFLMFGAGKVIPNWHDCANLTGEVHPEVRELVERWQDRGWVAGIWSGNFDWVVLDPEITAKVLTEMDSEWRDLQLKLLES